MLQFAARIDQVNLVLIAVQVTQQLTPSRPFVETEVSRAVALLSALGEKKAQLGPGPAAMVALEIASLRLKLGDVDAPKRALGDVKPTIDDLEGEGAEAIIAGTYFRVAAEYHKVVGPPTAFFDNALQFLSHVAWDSLPRASAEALAVDIALAALVGDKIFDFGALVSHPILALLDGSTGAADSAAAASASSSSSAAGGGGGGGGGRRGGAAAADDDGAEEEGAVDVLAMASHGTYGWLKALIFVFQRGDIDGFNALFATHAAAIRAHAVLAAATDVLKEKVTLLGLVELLARRPSSERTVRFDEIVAATHLELGQVEWLLMRGMSLGLLEGSIDEVEQVVRITSVKVRRERKGDMGEGRRGEGRGGEREAITSTSLLRFAATDPDAGTDQGATHAGGRVEDQRPPVAHLRRDAHAGTPRVEERGEEEE